jgi:hypothetical protein
MTFDSTVNLGQVITLFGFLAGGVVAFVSMRADLSAQARRLAFVEMEMRKQTDILVEFARQDERLRAFEHRLDHLEHGVT